MTYEEVNKEILNKKIKKIRVTKDPDNILFVFEDNSFAIMLHQQECCENVYIEDICGNLSDLEGATLYSFEEATNYDENAESGTWTFYNIKTSKGYVTIRWYGESNGYYSEKAEVIYYYSIEQYYKRYYNIDDIKTIEEYIDKYYKDYEVIV